MHTEISGSSAQEKTEVKVLANVPTYLKICCENKQFPVTLNFMYAKNGGDLAVYLHD